MTEDAIAAKGTEDTARSDGWLDLTGGAPLPELAELESTDKLEELMHRVRGPMLRHLRTPHSAAELAAELDVPVTRLYHHLKVLESAGFIEVVATRRVGAALERRYRAIARGFRVGPDAVRDAGDLARALASVLDSTRNDLVAAVESGAIDARVGPDAVDVDVDVAIWSLRLRLGQQDRVELIERMEAVLAEFRARSSDSADVGEFAVFGITFPTDIVGAPRGSKAPEK